MQKDKSQSWYLRIEAGEQYGPVDMETLLGWAMNGKVLSEDTVSRDGEVWGKASEAAELQMDTFIKRPDGVILGPFHANAIAALEFEGHFPADSHVFKKGEPAPPLGEPERRQEPEARSQKEKRKRKVPSNVSPSEDLLELGVHDKLHEYVVTGRATASRLAAQPTHLARLGGTPSPYPVRVVMYPELVPHCEDEGKSVQETPQEAHAVKQEDDEAMESMVAEARDAVAERDREIETLRQTLIEREEEVATLRNQSSVVTRQSSEEVETLRQALAEREEEVKALQNSLAEREEGIATLRQQSSIVNRQSNAEVETLHAALKTAEETVATLQNSLAEREERFAKVEEAAQGQWMAERGKAEQFRQALEERDEEIGKMRIAVKAADETVTAATEARVAAQAELDTLRKEYQELLAFSNTRDAELMAKVEALSVVPKEGEEARRAWAAEAQNMELKRDVEELKRRYDRDLEESEGRRLALEQQLKEAFKREGLLRDQLAQLQQAEGDYGSLSSQLKRREGLILKMERAAEEARITAKETEAALMRRIEELERGASTLLNRPEPPPNTENSEQH